MKKLLIAVAFVATTAASAADKAAEAKPAAPKLPDMRKESVYAAAADIVWNPLDPTHPEGPQIAFVSGDPKKGPVSMFMKFPAGFDSGWHTHKNWYAGTVIKGVITSQGQNDAAAKELPVGSFLSEPGGKNHKNTCTAAGECLCFFYNEKGFSFEPKTADGKNPPKEVAKAEGAKKEEGKKAEAPGQEKKEAAPGQAKKEEKK